MPNFPTPSEYFGYTIRAATNGYIVVAGCHDYVFLTLKSALKFIQECEEKKNGKR